ncbi:hypothetical protein H7E67_01165 [Clostridium gasigenes]|uniref:hypothetical protein n=1 Tax=Clostridium gasigenes TaxID=94869 RepID=UPI001627C01A|nr:hypothetical protein [Clostridium gasigenes]MBB6622029.1 hypothetical protein [Clostridium gasigenes]
MQWFFQESGGSSTGDRNSGCRSQRGLGKKEPENLTELYEELFPIALECGISSFLFWDMDYLEITETIKAYSRRKEKESREKAVFNYKLADLIGTSVKRILDEKQEMPPLWEVYPGMFEDYKAEHEEQQVQNNYWKTIRDRITVYGEMKKDKEVT